MRAAPSIVRSLQWLRRGISWRLTYRTEMLVLRAGPAFEPGVLPRGLQLLHVASPTDAGVELMRVWVPYPGEDPKLNSRLAHGDEAFGFTDGRTVVCAGWFTTRDRLVGVHKGRELPHRAFLYDFQTCDEWRGRGLYPALLIQMRYALGRRGFTEFIIESDIRNEASLRGIRKAGFSELARTSFRTYLRRWRHPLARTVSVEVLALDDLWSE